MRNNFFGKMNMLYLIIMLYLIAVSALETPLLTSYEKIEAPLTYCRIDTDKNTKSKSKPNTVAHLSNADTFSGTRDEENNDPYNLRERFVYQQRVHFKSALAEIQRGQKKGHWIWFILPTAPFLKGGVEHGSSTNRYYALRGDESIRAYLTFSDDDIDLRTNYLTLVRAVLKQLEGGSTLSYIFQHDTQKVISSLTLFQRIATDIGDGVLVDICQGVLDFAKVEKESVS